MFKNKEGKVRSGWKIAAVTGAFFASMMVFSIIIGLAMFLILMLNGNFDLQKIENLLLGEGSLNSGFRIFSMFFQEILMILTPVIAWKFIMKHPLTNMGLSSLKNHSCELLTGLLFGIVSISVVFISLVISNNVVVESWVPHFSPDTLIYLFLFILVGFAEEIYGRGYIMSVLRQTRNIPVVVIVSSVIFALMHSFNSGIALIPYINLTLVGVLFAYIYLKSGNIWMSIGYHITWNYFQGNVFGFKVSGTNTAGIITTVYKNENIYNGGKFGPEGGLFVTAVLLLGFLFVKHFYKDSKFDFLSTEPESVVINPKPESNTFYN